MDRLARPAPKPKDAVEMGDSPRVQELLLYDSEPGRPKQILVPHHLPELILGDVLVVVQLGQSLTYGCRT